MEGLRDLELCSPNEDPWRGFLRAMRASRQKKRKFFTAVKKIFTVLGDFLEWGRIVIPAAADDRSIRVR